MYIENKGFYMEIMFELTVEDKFCNHVEYCNENLIKKSIVFTKKIKSNKYKSHNVAIH